MADTARAEADCKEFFDSPQALQQKIKQLAELIRNSKHFCAFTGAGISTAAGIADFRSGINTVLDTGTGKWAAQSAKKSGKSKKIKKNKKPKKSIKAIPTASHMALVSLMTTGPQYLKCMISQNTDGLHRRSGMPVDQLCELHGNTTLEVCKKCGRGYMRDFRCRNSMRKQKCHDHRTGRKCVVPNCGGNLYDTIINFNENLNQATLDKAEQNTDQCDVMLALGSSLTVTPAADMPQEVGLRWANEVQSGQNPKNNLIIVNLQKTPLDNLCSIRIFAKIDDVMVPLMKELGLEIPEWKLQRFMKIKVEPNEDEEDQKLITISAVDVDGIDATVFDEVQLRHNGEPLKNPKTKIRGDTRKSKLNALVSRNKFKFKVSNDMVIPVDDQKENDKQSESGLVVELSFMGNYTEPNLCITLCPLLQNLKLSKSNDQENEEEQKEENQHGDNEFVCRLLMDIKDKKWTVEPYSVQPYSVKEIRDLAKGQEHQQKIDEFVKVTGLDNQSIAALFLKNSSWNLQIALSAFYEYAADPTVIPSMSKADINFDSVNTQNEENGVVEQESLTSIMERRSEQLRRSQEKNVDSVDTQNEEDGAVDQETIYRRPKDDVEPEETAEE